MAFFLDNAFSIFAFLFLFLLVLVLSYANGSGDKYAARGGLSAEISLSFTVFLFLLSFCFAAYRAVFYSIKTVEEPRLVLLSPSDVTSYRVEKKCDTRTSKMCYSHTEYVVINEGKHVFKDGQVKKGKNPSLLYVYKKTIITDSLTGKVEYVIPVSVKMYFAFPV